VIEFINEDNLDGVKISKVVNGEIKWAKLFNLCNHPIKYLAGDRVVEIPQAGTVSRANQVAEDIDPNDVVKISRPIYGDVYGIPEKKENTFYIVSHLTLSTLNDSRDDVISSWKTQGTGSDRIVLSFRRI